MFNNLDKKVLMGFITAGENGLSNMLDDLLAMEKEGFSVIELSLPFSDPAAENEEVQKNSLRSLEEGCTSDFVFDQLIESKNTRSLPLVLNLYLNTAYRYGYEKFMLKAKEAGISALIVQDLPFEEKEELAKVAREYDIAVISNIMPAPEDRVRKIAKNAEAFIALTLPQASREQVETYIRLIREESNLAILLTLDEASKDTLEEIPSDLAGIRVRRVCYK